MRSCVELVCKTRGKAYTTIIYKILGSAASKQTRARLLLLLMAAPNLFLSCRRLFACNTILRHVPSINVQVGLLHVLKDSAATVCYHTSWIIYHNYIASAGPQVLVGHVTKFALSRVINLRLRSKVVVVHNS